MTSQAFLKLLQCYVLNSIDALPEENRQALLAMEPRLRATYECDGTWKKIVAAQMDFPENFPDQIKEIWVRSQEIAQQSGHVLDPMEFVKLFLKDNFPYAIR